MNICNQIRELHGPEKNRSYVLSVSIFYEHLLSKMLIKKIDISKACSYMHLHIHNKEDITCVNSVCLHDSYISLMAALNKLA